MCMPILRITPMEATFSEVGGRRDNPLQVKLCERVVDQGLRRFSGVSLPLIGWGKGVIFASCEEQTR
jgi:hypothetical protein